MNDLIIMIRDNPSIFWWFKSVVYQLYCKNIPFSIDNIVKLNCGYKELKIKGIFISFVELNCFIRSKKSFDIMLEEYKIDIEKFELICREIIGILKYLNEIESKGKNLKYSIISNIPYIPNMRNKYIELNRKIKSIPDSILGLISEAQKEVIILNPFFDYEGVFFISDELKGILDKGIIIRIITRYVDNDDTRNKQLLRELQNYAYQKNKLFSLYKYHYNEEFNKSKTFHAKSIIIDYGQKAYLGSANITGWGLEEQLEVGVIIEDNNAKLLYNIIEYLDEAKIIKKVYNIGGLLDEEERKSSS